MNKVNYKSDFDFFLVIRDCRGTDIGFPDFDWECRFYTVQKANAFEVSYKGGVYTNCFNDRGRIHVVCDNHGLSAGEIEAELNVFLPNEIYPDGNQHLSTPFSAEIKLIKGPAPCPSTAEVEATIPSIKLKYTDLTDKDKAEMTAPLKEELDNFMTEARAEIAEAKQTVQAASQTVTEATGQLEDIASRKVAEIVDGAPEQFDTLREIADALNSDKEGSVVNAIVTTLAQKANASDFEELTDEDIEAAVSDVQTAQE